MNIGILILKRFGSYVWDRIRQLVDWVRKSIAERFSGSRDQPKDDQ